MAITGAAKAKEVELPRSATITIHERTPSPRGEVEVEPGIGRIHFKNKDKHDYRLRFSTQNTEFPGFNILLPGKGSVTVLIQKNDEWTYTVFSIGDAFNGIGGGPIRN